MSIIGQCRFNIQRVHVIYSPIQHSLRLFKKKCEKLNARYDFKWQLWSAQVGNIVAVRKWRFSVHWNWKIILRRMVIENEILHRIWHISRNDSNQRCLECCLQSISNEKKCFSYENLNLFIFRENDLVVVWKWNSWICWYWLQWKSKEKQSYKKKVSMCLASVVEVKVLFQWKKLHMKIRNYSLTEIEYWEKIRW